MNNLISNYESLHPILVHFPIALLSVYVILECLRFKKILKSSSLHAIKFFLVVVGFLAGIAAYAAGPDGQSIHAWSGYANISSPTVRQIVSMHSNFASWSLVVFGIIAFSYIVLWIRDVTISNPKFAAGSISNSWFMPVWRFIISIGEFIQKPFVIILLAIIGLIFVTITGALGGSIVYGPNIDPVVSFVFHLFFANSAIK